MSLIALQRSHSFLHYAKSLKDRKRSAECIHQFVGSADRLPSVDPSARLPPIISHSMKKEIYQNSKEAFSVLFYSSYCPQTGAKSQRHLCVCATSHFNTTIILVPIHVQTHNKIKSSTFRNQTLLRVVYDVTSHNLIHPSAQINITLHQSRDGEPLRDNMPFFKVMFFQVLHVPSI